MLDICNGDNSEVFKIFNDELYIPAAKTGKMTHTYLDEENETVIEDYLGNVAHVTTKSSIHLENCEFTLSISEQYKKFLANLLQGYIYKGQKNA